MFKKQAVKRVFYTVYEEYIIQYHIQKEGMLHPASNLIYSSFQGSEITTLPKAVEFAGFFHGMNLRNYRSPNRSDWVGHCIGKKRWCITLCWLLRLFSFVFSLPFWECQSIILFGKVQPDQPPTSLWRDLEFFKWVFTHGYIATPWLPNSWSDPMHLKRVWVFD